MDQATVSARHSSVDISSGSWCQAQLKQVYTGRAENGFSRRERVHPTSASAIITADVRSISDLDDGV